jgi:hypothetical protein
LGHTRFSWTWVYCSTPHVFSLRDPGSRKLPHGVCYAYESVIQRKHCSSELLLRLSHCPVYNILYIKASQVANPKTSRYGIIIVHRKVMLKGEINNYENIMLLYSTVCYSLEDIRPSETHRDILKSLNLFMP